MELKIKEITDKKTWEDFLLECEEKTFLDSWNWGEFQRMMGDKVWRIGVYESENLRAAALVIKVSARRGTFLFVPHGPTVKHEVSSDKHQALNALLAELKKIAKNENASFIRIAPVLERNEENAKIFKDFGFREAPIHMHPELSWELNITLSEEEIFNGMRKTTRYLIRQGLKNPDLKIEQSDNIEDVEKFNKLYQETVDRHNFAPFSLGYLKNEFSAFLQDNQISLFLATYQGEILASAMIIFWQGAAFYHQGASTLKHSKIPATYLLQWEVIREAKKRGCKVYNFWGIAPNEDVRHPWAGLTLFKMGFGGYKKEYVKTQDLPLSNKYWLTFFFEKLRKAKRGL